MATDTSSDHDGPVKRWPRWEDWVQSPRFVIGSVMVGLTVVTVVFVALGPEGMLSEVTAAQALFLGSVSLVVGSAVILSGYRLTKRQQQYLARANREIEEIQDYLENLDETTAAGHGRGRGRSPSDEGEGAREDRGPDGEREAGSTPLPAGLPAPWEVRSRLELAERNLRRAKDAVYRRDYASFLSLYYEATRQEILLYDYLDRPSKGWAFGLRSEDGDVAVPDPESTDGPGPHRRWNLARRIRSFAWDSLSGHRLRLVRDYLGAPGVLPTTWELYYAVRVLHDWNVGRHERALHVKRFLRIGIAVLSVVLIGLVLFLPRAFEDGFVTGTASGSTDSSAQTLGIVLGTPSNDTFLVLVLLAGALGAVFSMLLRSFGEFYTLTTDPSVPEPVFMLEALVARTLIGGVSALVLFVVAQSDLGAVVLAGDLLSSPSALLLLGFAAGLSERFVKRSLDEVVDRVGGEGSTDDWAWETRRAAGRSGGAGASPGAEPGTTEGTAGLTAPGRPGEDAEVGGDAGGGDDEGSAGGDDDGGADDGDGDRSGTPGSP